MAPALTIAFSFVHVTEGPSPYNYSRPCTTNSFVPAMSGVTTNPISFLFPKIVIVIFPGKFAVELPAFRDPARIHML